MPCDNNVSPTEAVSITASKTKYRCGERVCFISFNSIGDAHGKGALPLDLDGKKIKLCLWCVVPKRTNQGIKFGRLDAQFAAVRHRPRARVSQNQAAVRPLGLPPVTNPSDLVPRYCALTPKVTLHQSAPTDFPRKGQIAADQQSHKKQLNDPNKEVRPADGFMRLLVEPRKAQPEPYRRSRQHRPLEL